MPGKYALSSRLGFSTGQLTAMLEFRFARSAGGKIVPAGLVVLVADVLDLVGSTPECTVVGLLEDDRSVFTPPSRCRRGGRGEARREPRGVLPHRTIATRLPA